MTSHGEPLQGVGRLARPFWRRWGALVALALSILTISALPGSASAAVPTFPDNIVVFPDRDFISAEGFESHVGETNVLVEVTRPGIGVVGSTRVDMAPGGVPFEVNHPGGFCWGAGTGLNVTPDIKPGDVVSVTFGDGTTSDVTTQDAFVEAVNYVDGADTFTITGHIDPLTVNLDNTEQRIVNPALVDTPVGRRDVRAVPGPLTPDRNGQYQSSLEFTGDTFTATYVFLDPDVARIAATGGGERLLSWQVTDADANRQGITIAEFGELGGPGMGGCPNGPLQSGPPAPSNVTAVNVAAGIKVDWTPAVAIPGTPDITGYRVTAVGPQAASSVEQVEIGRRINSRTATGTTITGLQSGVTYDVYVVSMSAAGETFPAIHAIPVTDTTRPTLTADPGGGTFGTAQSVRLSADEPNAQIFFTTDGTDPIDVAGDPAGSATLYTQPILIASTTTLKAVAFDPAGNVSQPVFEATYTIDATAVLPGAPTIDASSVGVGSVTLDWSLADASAFGVDGYRVRVENQDGTLRDDVSPNPLDPTTATQLTVTGLTEGTAYYFTVAAHNANGWGPPSAQVGPLVPLGTVVANAGPDQTVTRGLAPTTVTLTGAGSTTGAGVTYHWQQLKAGIPMIPTDPDFVTLAEPTALSTTFSLPLFRTPQTNTPKEFRLTVTDAGGVQRTDEVSVTPVAGDSIAGIRAKWKAGDFRVDGTGTVDGALITIHSGSLSGPVLGTANVVAGAWTLRLRNAAAPATRPASLWIESTVGATAGPITVT